MLPVGGDEQNDMSEAEHQPAATKPSIRWFQPAPSRFVIAPVAAVGLAIALSVLGCEWGADRNSPLAEECRSISQAVCDMGGAGASYSTVHTPAGDFNQVQLHFRDHQVNNRSLQYLEGFTAIIGIDLSGTQVTDKGMAVVGSLKGLEYLQLSGTSISDAGLAELRGLERLEAIDLSHTKVTQAGAKYLEQLRKLKRIYAVGTNLKEVSGKKVDRSTDSKSWTDGRWISPKWPDNWRGRKPDEIDAKIEREGAELVPLEERMRTGH